MHYIFWFILTLFFYCHQTAGAQRFKPYEKLFHAADSIVSANFSGVILISLPNGESRTFTGGISNKETERAIKEDDAFNLFSLGKSFTAAMAVKLIQEGKLKINDTIDNYLPHRDIPNQKQITTGHLLSHTSGLGDYMTGASFNALPYSEISDSLVMSTIEKQPAVKAPGESFVYSNSGYILLGAVAEAIEESNYKDILHDKILKPAGIQKVYFSPGKRKVRYYAKSCNELNDSFPSALADGGIWMKANDVLRFINLLYSGEFTEKSRALLFSRITTLPDRGDRKNAGLAASFLVYEYPDKVNVVGNNGGFKGSTYSSFRILYRNPDQRLVFIVLSNREDTAGPAAGILEKAGRMAFK